MADEPVATGTLAKTAFPHLLIYLDQKQLSGTLALWPDVIPEGQNAQDRILFLKGKPVAGRVLEPAKTLREALLRMFYRTEAPYAFYESNLLGGPEERLNGRVDSLGLIAESLRMTAREDVVEGVLARVGRAKLRMQPKVELARFELTPEERVLVELMMAEPASIDALVEGSGLVRARGRRLLYLLLISKAAAPYDEGARPPANAPPPGPAVAPAAAVSPAPAAEAPASPAPQPPPAAASPSVPPDLTGFSKPPSGRIDRLAEMPPPPEGLRAEHAERWQKLVARGRLVENQNYFEMLGVDKKIQSAEVTAEFFKLAKEWHPDRLPAELAPLKPYAEIIFSYMNEAHKVLSDEDQRIAYLRTVREGGGTPAAERLMQDIIDSAVQYEHVLVFARRHQYTEALELLQRILLVTKDEPDYQAMLGWLLMQKFPGPDAPVQRIFEALDRALELHEDHEKANLYKAQLLKRAGRHEDALRFFKKVVAINPNNVDAAREVRVAQMREDKHAQAATAKGAAAGLLGKLLGDKGKKR